MSKGKEKLDVLLMGYNGVNNTGSEAKLLTTIRDVREVFGHRLGEISVFTQNLENQRRYVKDDSIRLRRLATSSLLRPEVILGRSDILLLSEGSTFIDHFSSVFIQIFCFAAWVAKLKGQKVVAYANDCGHLKPINQRILRRTLNKYVDLIMLRNPDAKERMVQYGVTRPINVTADGAYLYPAPSQETVDSMCKRLEVDPQKRSVVGIAPKEFFFWPVAPKLFGRREDLYMWPFYHSWTEEGRRSSNLYVEQTARYADWVVENLDADVLLIAMEHMDYPPIKAIYETMRNRERARLVPSDEFVVDEIVAALSLLRFQVTTRYHTTVLASMFGVPMISVSSDTRCEAVFRELDMMDLYIDYVKHPEPSPKVTELCDRLVGMTESLLAREEELKSRILEAHESFQERARMNRSLPGKWLEQSFPV